MRLLLLQPELGCLMYCLYQADRLHHDPMCKPYRLMQVLHYDTYLVQP